MREQSFLIDQRTTRKMVIGNVDIDTTNQLRKTLKRKLLTQKSRCNPQKEMSENLNITISSSSSKYDSDDTLKLQSQVTKMIPENKPTINIDYDLLSKHAIDIKCQTELGRPSLQRFCIMQKMLKLLTKISYAGSAKKQENV